MPLQTSFSFTHDPAVAGMEYGVGLHQIDSAIAFVNGSVVKGLPLGAGVVETTKGSNLQQDGRKYATFPGNGNGNFLGIVCHRHVEKAADSKRTPVYQVNSNEYSQYEDGDSVPVGVFGRFYVEVSEAVSPGDSVFIHNVDLAAPTATDGKFNTSTGTDISTKAKWVTSTDGAGIAVVEINNIA